jgi:uncharacterized membrane protein YgdD (TMEM256/DUF423 family)
MKRKQMNCGNHIDDAAIAICVSCGAGLCSACAQKTDTGKNVCSTKCAATVNAMDRAILSIAENSLRGYKAIAWLGWLVGAVLVVEGLSSLAHNDMRDAVFLTPGGAIFIFMGFWYARIAKRMSSPDNVL